jgi:hypothetical protein
MAVRLEVLVDARGLLPKYIIILLEALVSVGV